MTVEITGRHIDLSERTREYTEEKLSKLERLMDQLSIHVTLTPEKHRYCCSIVAHGKGVTYTSERIEDDLFAAINGSVEVLSRKLRKNKTSRLSDRRPGSDSIRHLDGGEEAVNE